MDERQQAAVAAQLAELRQAYLARLPAELAALQSLAADLGGGEADRARLDELRHRLHKLAGSGGTFGLAALSAAARTLEQRVKGWLAGGLAELDDGQVRQALAAGLAALGASLSENDHPASLARGHASPPSADEANEVWLIEDDALLGEELARQLGAFSYRVRLFTRLDDAERAAQTGRPDLLLMDVMFDEEGKNATESFARHLGLRALACPLFFISAHDDFLSRVRAARLGAPVTLAMIDIDHLKSVNDTYGHAAGDVVISAVAMLLHQRLRRSDIIGRYGGEEFAAVLPECDAALYVAKRSGRNQVQEARPV